MDIFGIDFLKQIIEYRPSETAGIFKGHQISVQLSTTQLKLYIDGLCVDSVKPFLWPQPDVILVSGSIREGNQDHIVAVYGRSSLIRAKIKICVDGEKIAGDEF